MQVWVNGRLVPNPRAPSLSVLDHAVTVGDGAFEVVKVTGGRTFALTRHLDRLSRSAAGLGLPAPDHVVIRAAVREVLAAEHVAQGRVRITLTGGVGPLGTARLDRPATGLVVAAIAADPQPATCSVVTVPWSRNEGGALAGIKSTSYAENAVALFRAHQHGAAEAIFPNTRGHLCEGTGTNVFCVIGGRVVTPPWTAGCLEGITRGLVLEWCDVEERDITMAEFAASSEVFLTSTTRDVQGVSRLDGERLKAPGPATEAIARTFAKRAADDLDP